MTAQTPPIFLQAGSHPAEDVRRAFGSLLANDGIASSGALAVTQNGTPNMSVNVAEGQLAMTGSESSYAGVYLCESRGTTNLAISAADATNPRRDLVIARVRDSAYSGATDTFSLEIVTGTPAGSPADPSLPSGTVFVIARVAVAASASSITNANITDLRTSYASSQYGLMAAAGGTVVCSSSTRPTGFEGLKIYEVDTDIEYSYNGSVWVPTAHLGAWTDYTPTLTQSGTVTKTITSASYVKIGRIVTVEFVLSVTGTGSSSNAVRVSLPFTAANLGTKAGALTIYDASAATFYSVTTRLYDTGAVSGVPYGTSNWIGAAGFTAALASGDSVEGSLVYEATS